MHDEQKDHELEQIISYILSKINADKIMLFGSRARGDFRKNSDYDILILIKNMKGRQRILSDLYSTYGLIESDVDFLVVDYDAYEELKNWTGYIYKTVAREGKVIYKKLL